MFYPVEMMEKNFNNDLKKGYRNPTGFRRWVKVAKITCFITYVQIFDMRILSAYQWK